MNRPIWASAWLRNRRRPPYNGRRGGAVGREGIPVLDRRRALGQNGGGRDDPFGHLAEKWPPSWPPNPRRTSHDMPRSTPPAPGAPRGGAGGEVAEERLARGGLLLIEHHADGPVGQVLGQVVALCRGSGRIDDVLSWQRAGPTARLGAQETVVALEALGDRPAVHRTGRRVPPAGKGATFPRPWCCTVVSQYARQEGRRFRDPAGIPGNPMGVSMVMPMPTA